MLNRWSQSSWRHSTCCDSWAKFSVWQKHEPISILLMPVTPSFFIIEVICMRLIFPILLIQRPHLALKKPNPNSCHIAAEVNWKECFGFICFRRSFFGLLIFGNIKGIPSHKIYSIIIGIRWKTHMCSLLDRSHSVEEFPHTLIQSARCGQLQSFSSSFAKGLRQSFSNWLSLTKKTCNHSFSHPVLDMRERKHVRTWDFFNKADCF